MDTWKVVPGSIPFRGRRKKKQFAAILPMSHQTSAQGKVQVMHLQMTIMGVVWNCHFRDTACAMDQTILVLWISVVFAKILYL